MPGMICQACGQREASVLAHTVVANQVKKTALCASCAAELAPAHALDALMSALAALGARPRVHPGRCPGCRTSFAEFRESGRFGCPQCYERFLPQVKDLLPRVHAGAYHHRGKTPGRR
jgi:protein arginine kinase activator